MRTYANEKGIKAYNFAVPVTVNCPLGSNYYQIGRASCRERV